LKIHLLLAELLVEGGNASEQGIEGRRGDNACFGDVTRFDEEPTN